MGSANAKALQIEATVAASGIWTNEAEVSTTNPPDQFDPDLTNNKGSATIKTREADLLVNKTVNDATPNVGDIITFTIDVTNNGPDVANNVLDVIHDQPGDVVHRRLALFLAQIVAEQHHASLT